MKRPVRQKRAAAALFALTAALFLLFFAYIFFAEHVTVHYAEKTHYYSEWTDLEMELVPDAQAPAGVRKVYRGILDPNRSNESCLCFNIAYHEIRVYFGDQLVYSLTGAETNRIGRNVGSNWCSVHVGQEHAGESVTIVLTPLLEAAVSKNTTFLLGSHYSIAMDLLCRELPQIILCALCVLIGMVVVAVFVYFKFFLRLNPGGMVYLGLFAIFTGLWKLTDLPSMPMLMPGQSMAISYICIGSLFLVSPSLLLYLGTLFVSHRRRLMRLAACGSCVVCLAVLGAQVLGIQEVRQSLVFSHVLLIIAIISLPAAAVYNRIVHKQYGLIRSWKLLLLLFAGIILDLAVYYRHNDNFTISFAVLGLVLYTLIVFLRMIQNTARKANTDSLTGLLSRTRWNELTGSHSLPETYAIIVCDLNGLKTVNDTLGHDMGDQLIFRFSSILRNVLPPASVICRWGGDEFAALLAPATRPLLETQLESLSAAVRTYNAESPSLPIHYAAGAALNTEHPGLPPDEIFRLADEAMYRSKEQWYIQNGLR